MSERAVVFGDAELSGILTEPEIAASGAGFLFLSAGIIHRVGPNRLHVTLARALAAAGFPALRFDFSGIGESGHASGERPYDELIVHEARAAMDVLATAGSERILLLGLCSGADNAIRIALADSRVVGAVLLQSYSFSGRGYQLEYYARRALRPSSLWRLVRGRMNLRAVCRGILSHLRAPAPAGGIEGEDPSRFWKMPPAERIVADVSTLAARNVRLLFVHSARSPAEYNFRRILARKTRALVRKGLVQVEVLTECDHSFTPLAHRARVVAHVVEWASLPEVHATAPEVTAASRISLGSGRRAP